MLRLSRWRQTARRRTRSRCRVAPRSSSRSSCARPRTNPLAPARPLARLHRALREKQEKGDEKDEVGDVREIDHALGEAAELVEQREATDHFEPRVGERGLVPVENPEEE